MSLGDTQRRLREAVVAQRPESVLPLLVGGRHPQGRLAIHQRHYRASLVTALLSRFQATQWLVGSAPLIEAARTFVHGRPPLAPCIAEYGADFPAWLAGEPLAGRVPFLADFAELDWQLGRVAVDLDRPPCAAGRLAGLDAETLADVTLHLQTGLHYLHSTWPIDSMMQLYVTGTDPGDEPMRPADVWLEVRGARGAFTFTRLSAAEFVFRQAVRSGETLATSAALALEADRTFDPGRALAALFAAGLPTSMGAARATT